MNLPRRFIIEEDDFSVLLFVAQPMFLARSGIDRHDSVAFRVQFVQARKITVILRPSGKASQDLPASLCGQAVLNARNA